MKDVDTTGWQRMGSSIVWSPELLGPLITGGTAVPLRAVLRWVHEGFPSEPPGGGQTILVGGLQTVMETLMSSGSADEAFQWLRSNMLPLVRAVQANWDRVGLVFGVDGPARMYHHYEPDDLVYFGRSKDRDANVRITLGIWNGAATGEGAYRLLIPGSREIGGYHVRRVS